MTPDGHNIFDWTRVAGLERLTELRVLNAAHNSLLTVDAAFSTDHPLACLNLSGNCLTSLAGLVSCSSLLQADVSRNLLTHLQPLAACSCLQVRNFSRWDVLCIPVVFREEF